MNLGLIKLPHNRFNFSFIFFLFFFCSSIAAKPVFVVTSATKSVTLSPTGRSQITFSVRNNTPKTITITHTNVAFSKDGLLNGSIHRDLCKGQLGKGASCTITTTIAALGSLGQSDFEIQVCAFNGALCSGMKTKIKVTTSSDGGGDSPTPTPDNEEAPLSLSSNTLVLIPSPIGNVTGLTGSAGSLTVTNQSQTITATNVSASLPSSLMDITQDASNCETLLPGASCVLRFTAASQEHAATNITIAGDNTDMVTASIKVFIPWGNDGALLASAYDASTNILYLGGDFQFHGPQTGSVGMSDLEGNALPFVRVNGGEIWAVISDGNGGFYISGSFTHVDGVAHRGVAHILSDNTLDADFNFQMTTGGLVRTMVLSNGRLYIAGNFTEINAGGANNRVNIAALNPTTGATDAWYPAGGANGEIFAMIIQSGVIYVGGNFSGAGGIGGENIDRLAAITPDTGVVINNWTPNPAARVISLASDGTNLYVGGDFNHPANPTICGVNRNYLAAINLTTLAGIPCSVDAPWDPDMDNPVSGLAVHNNILYAAGRFNTVNGGGTARSRLAAFNLADGGSAATPDPWNPTAGGNTRSFAFTNNSVFVSGAFTTMGGNPHQRIAELELANGANTGNTTSFNAGAEGMVRDIAISNNRLVAGGSFYFYPLVERNNLAAIDLNTGQLTNWNPNVDGAVHMMLLHNGYLYVGGEFNNVNVGQVSQAVRNHLAAFDKTTGIVESTWDPDMNDYVFALAIDGNTLYAGGDFTTVNRAAYHTNNQQALNRIAALEMIGQGNGRGDVDNTWNPITTGFSVDALLIHNGYLYVGGDFSQIAPGGAGNRNHVAAFSLPARTLDPWNPNVNAGSKVRGIVAGDDKIFIAGDFNQVKGGTVRNHAAAFDEANGVSTAVLDGWNPNPDSELYAIAFFNNVVYLGGQFSNINGAPGPGGITAREGFAAVDLNTGLVLDPNLNLDFGPDYLGVNSELEHLLIGGYFLEANNFPLFGFTILHPSS